MTFLHFSATAILLLANILVSHNSLLGSQRGTIRGTVKNIVTKEPVNGALVRLRNVNIVTASDSLGGFLFDELPSGTYQLEISAIGFAPCIYSDIRVTPVKPAEIVILLVETPVTLPEMQVSARYFHRSPDAQMSAQSLSYGEIKHQAGGFEDPLRALAVLPGIAHVEVGRNDLIVRGGAPSENLFLLDGIEVPGINHFATVGVGGGPISYVNMDFVENISFSAGGFSVSRGNKISSVTEIDLKSGRTDRIGGSASLSATQFSLNAEGPVGATGTMFLTARRTYLDWIFRSAGLSFIPQYYDVLSKSNWRMGGSDDISTLLVGVLDDINPVNNSYQARSDNSAIIETHQQLFVGGMTWRHLFPKGYLRTSASVTSQQFQNYQNDIHLVPVFDESARETQLHFSSQVVVQPIRGSEISAGGECSFLNSGTGIYFLALNSSFSDYLRTVRYTHDTVATLQALFAQVSQRVLQRWEITLGGRVDQSSLLWNSGSNVVRASVAFSPTSSITISGSAGQYAQTPPTIWVISNGFNRDLRWIHSNQYAIGIENTFGEDWKGSIEGFVKRYDGYPCSLTRPYIIQSNTGIGYDYGPVDGFASFGFGPLVSEGTGRSAGIEGFLQKKLSSTPYYGMVSLSISDVHFTPLDGIERPGAFDQRFILNVVGGWRPADEWEFSAKFRFSTGRPYTPYDSAGNQEITNLYAQRFSPAHALDLRVDKRWQFPSWNLITYVDIQNIYNRRNQTFNRFNYQTRELEQIERIGILPSVGITGEF